MARTILCVTPFLLRSLPYCAPLSSVASYVSKVEVSSDLGKTWHSAEVNRGEILKDDSSRAWHWVRWTATVTIPHNAVRTVNTAAMQKRKDASDPKMVRATLVLYSSFCIIFTSSVQWRDSPVHTEI